MKNNSSRRVTARYAVNESSYFVGCNLYDTEDGNQGGNADFIRPLYVMHAGDFFICKKEQFGCITENYTKIFIEKERMQ